MLCLPKGSPDLRYAMMSATTWQIRPLNCFSLGRLAPPTIPSRAYPLCAYRRD